MQAAVNNIATLNGIATSAISASVVNSPSGDGNQAVEVTVSTSVPLILSRVLWSQNTLPISVSSYAELESGAPGCIMNAINDALRPLGAKLLTDMPFTPGKILHALGKV